MKHRLALAVVITALATAWFVRSIFERDSALAVEQAAQGSVVAATRCGPIEYQDAGQGRPLLVVHGSGGWHDQGTAFARDLTQRGFRVIALSRFGDLRTPMPRDASPTAQALAQTCLLDTLGVPRVAVTGLSADAPSAVQRAIRNPERVDALALVVPIACKPQGVADPTPPAPSTAEDEWLLRIPGSARAAGLRSDTGLGRRPEPCALSSIRAPTRVISARDDGFGTWPGAQDMASRIPQSRFVDFDRGGHLLGGTATPCSRQSSSTWTGRAGDDAAFYGIATRTASQRAANASTSTGRPVSASIAIARSSSRSASYSRNWRSSTARSASDASVRPA